jgi:hypothetical protein
MRVGVHRDADLTVAQNFHHDPRLHTLNKQKGSCGMSQIVNAHLRQLRSVQNDLELASDVALIERRADGCGEYEARFNPRAPSGKLRLLLSEPLATQRCDGELRQADGAAAAVTLRFNESKPFLGPLKRPTDTKSFSF